MENENLSSNINFPPVDNKQNNPNQKSSAGSIIATLIIIAVLVLGGLYFWGKRIEAERERRQILSNESVEDENGAMMEAKTIEQVSTDDGVNTIQAELKATSIDSL